MSQVANYMSVTPKATIARLFLSIYHHHALILALALRDLQSRYAGTLGGVLWTFAHPVAVISIFYFVFAIGFRSQGPARTPFILWFVCGYVPWLFFNETLLAATDSITWHAHLIKKTVFPSEILPFFHLTSGLVLHAIFLLIVVGMLAFFNVPFQAGRFLVIYFLICSCVFLLGLGWMLSAPQVFYRDISHALSIILNLWFWVTPIVWSPNNIPAEYQGLLFHNPMDYIIEGYRGLLNFDTAVWPSAGQTAYFWSIATLTFVVGAYVFGRLKPEFVDVM